MLKQLVQFTDFDGANKTKNLYFNLTRSEVIDNIEIKDEFQEIYTLISGGERDRDLEMHEVKMILTLVKKLMKMSYGVQRQTPDGDLKFTKKDTQIWDDFVETAAYDAFVMSLFEVPGKAIEFLFGIWPVELTDKMDKDQLLLEGMPVKMDGQPLERPLRVAPDVQEVPMEPTHADSYTREALLAMPKEQFDEVVGSDPQKMTPLQLQVAFQRRASGN